jgi:MoxR-like ATPase
MLDKFRASTRQLETLIVGKPTQIRLSLTCLLAGGHLLIEDAPGVGKTTLAHGLALTLGLPFRRIQFTSDLLPSDIIGVTVYERGAEQFRFHPGPVFTHVLLADEINRASPRSQSALLEAMEENQVSVDGNSQALPQPFFVIATQNPLSQIGTYPLPEAQLDRFLMCLSLGYPDHQSERALLAGEARRDLLAQLQPVCQAQDLLVARKRIQQIHCSDALIDYVQALLQYSRHGGDYLEGLSPRAGLALIAAARAWAWLDGRNHVIPEDVQSVLPSVVAHRLRPRQAIDGRMVAAKELAIGLLQAVSVP